MTIVNDPRRDDPCPPVAPAAPGSSTSSFPCSPGVRPTGTPKSRYDTEEWLEWLNAAEPDHFSAALDEAEKAGAMRWIAIYASCVLGPPIRRRRLANEGQIAAAIADIAREAEGKMFWE